ncbi:DUF1266 domain-containing protein [Aeromonas veronii]|uniref:DUF1266 domain-containing protein n=1 Tax=Aeromonas veronii TaxID=654 RepID=UPI003D19C9DF
MKLPASIILISTLLFGCTDTKLPETDTIKWINTAHALLIKVNGGEYGLYSGFDNNIANEFKAKLSLKSSWGINDRYDADEMIKWLINSGHRQNFIDEMNALKKANVLNISRTQAINFLKLTKQDKASIYMSLVDVYKKHGEGAIDAWDYCRALNLLSTAYLAGYYTKEEALNN